MKQKLKMSEYEGVIDFSKEKEVKKKPIEKKVFFVEIGFSR